MTELDNSYCVPRTVEEWRELGAGKSWGLTDHSVVYTSKPVSADVDIVKHFSNEVLAGPVIRNRTEIPVSRFLDMLHDRIVPWRLEEIGFNNPLGDTYKLRLSHDWDDVIVTRMIRVIGGRVSVNGDDVNVATFADLLTLIRMLTPPSK